MLGIYTKILLHFTLFESLKALQFISFYYFYKLVYMTAINNNNQYTFTVENTKLSSTGITFYEITYSVVEDINENVELRKNGIQIIWRRYSEVRDLYKLLSKKHSFVKLSELPKGSYLDRFKPEVGAGKPKTKVIRNTVFTLIIGN